MDAATRLVLANVRDSLVPDRSLLTLDAADAAYMSRQLYYDSDLIVDPSTGIGSFYGRGVLDSAERRRHRYDPRRCVAWTRGARQEARRLGLDMDSIADLLGTDFMADPSERGRYRESPGRWARHVAVDDAANLFLRRELTRIMARIVEIEKRKEDHRSAFPVENFSQIGLTSFAWEQIQADSPEAVAADPNNDSPTPTVSLEVAEQLRRFQGFKHGFNVPWYEAQQIAAARANGAPDRQVNARKAKESKEQLMRAEARVVYHGLRAKNLTGLLSQTDDADVDPIDADPLTPAKNLQKIPQVATPVTGKWLSNANGLTQGTPAEMRDILVKGYTAVGAVTDNVERPDTIGLGTEDFISVHATNFRDGSSSVTESVADVAMKQLRPMGLRAIRWEPQLGHRPQLGTKLAAKDSAFGNPASLTSLATKYSGGLFKRNVMSVYARDVDKLSIVLAHDVLMRPPEIVNGNELVTLWLFLHGLLVKQPQSVRLVCSPALP